jgi:hypothetical protein
MPLTIDNQLVRNDYSRIFRDANKVNRLNNFADRSNRIG